MLEFECGEEIVIWGWSEIYCGIKSESQNIMNYNNLCICVL